MGFSRQEYWRGLPFPSPEDPSNLGIKLRSPALQAGSLPSEPPGKPLQSCVVDYMYNRYGCGMYDSSPKNGKGEHSKFIYETSNALITKTMEDIRKQQTNISYEYK